MTESNTRSGGMPAGVTESLERMRLAWNAGDADAYAAEFAEDATYVIFTGALTVGSASIRDDHIPLFTTWQKGSRLSIRVLDVNRLHDDAVVVVTEGGIGKGKTVRHNKMQTYVFVRQPDRWVCSAFQNTRRNRLLNAINSREQKRLAKKASVRP
ncbi:MAG: SgcJ/EcaC family oxidoreductase [Gordonia amarae]